MLKTSRKLRVVFTQILIEDSGHRGRVVTMHINQGIERALAQENRDYAFYGDSAKQMRYESASSADIFNQKKNEMSYPNELSQSEQEFSGIEYSGY